ncbi:uncharacterized protein LOC143374540 isoform X2 [Andrena cerasifolii]|uniref:uncharacterized protein LOC143374540 isoform X2 n=1 Tax=Andrena cerasifolii TaxID=2819439 RepID=UPI00403763E9
MTRRRRAPLVLGVCIGMFLLVFSTVAADTTKGPPLIPEELFAPNASIVQPNKAIPNKVPPGNDTEITFSRNSKEFVDSSNSTKINLNAKSAKSESEEKVATPINKDVVAEGIRSSNEVDRLSNSDSTNGGLKFDEILYAVSGKSSSPKTLTRLSRTNDLTSVTTKPALEESKLDEKTNKTNRIQQLGNDTSDHDTSKNIKSLENGVESKGEQKSDTKATSGGSSKELVEMSNLKLETASFGNDSTVRNAPLLGQLQQRVKKAEDLGPMKNLEVLDLKEADEGKGTDEPISLINDTYVNYYKTSTEKNFETGLGNQSGASENPTNFISDESAVTHGPGDPKEEVEVVGNMTHPTVEKVVEQQSEDSTLKNAEHLDVLSQKSIYNSTKTVEPSQASEAQELISEKHQQKLVDLTTQRPNPDETSTLQAVSSPVPRGRTIGFSGMNEYPSLEPKTTVASKIDVSFTKKNISSDKLLDQKPYPYARSSVKEQIHNSSNQVDLTTEEPSALENTIGRGRAEEKFVVTEASDVLENSIQQFKSTYYEKTANESSTVSTTELRSSIPMTTVSLARVEEAAPTNQSTNDKSNDLKTIVAPEEKSTSTGNDVPRWIEGRETITSKGNFDVTGNGITEVSLKPENDNKRTYDLPFQEIASRTTLAPSTTESVGKPQTEVGMPSNADVQTNVGSSLLIRSTLNATELFTEYPLVKANFSKGVMSTIPIASPLDAPTVRVTESAMMLSATTTDEIPVGNATEPPAPSDTNGTNEIPTNGSGTLSPDDAFVQTTTSIAYEFVGLSETTTYLSQNVTEDDSDSHGPLSGAFTTVPTVRDSLAKNSSNEASTISVSTTTDSFLSISEAKTVDVDDRSLSIAVTEQTIVPTTQFRDDFTTVLSVVEGETTQTSMLEDVQNSSVIDVWTTTSDEGIVTTVTMGQSPSPGSKDPHFISNATDTSTEFSLTSNIGTIDDRWMVTSSSLRPKVAELSTTSSSSATDMPKETTGGTMVLPSPEEITSLVRIVMEGSLQEVCPKMDKLKLTLAEILTSAMNRSVSDKQIIFHQDPCRESPSPTPTPSGMPLTSILVYVVDENSRFDSSMTNSLPNLYKESQDRVKFPVTETIPDSGNAIAVLVVSSVAFICLVLLTGLLFIMRKRQTRFNYGERCRPVSLDAYSLDSVSAYNSVRRKGAARSSKRSYGNPTFEDTTAIPSHPLNFAGLSSFCNDVNAINEEFSGIPQVSAKIDELPTGAELKNRYANVIPLPETRVPLQKINNDPLSEYINASYVRGPKNAMRYYIACQAPMEATVTDFWRMIWEQQCKVIIMLTDLVENGVEKCIEYIPPSEITDCHRLYGDFQVTLKKRETKEKYAISTLHLKNLENNTFREVYHIWYLWPVNGAQSDGAGLIAVLLEARALQRGGPGPIVVHCSPGTGRTGTLIALDLGIRQYEITRTVDVPRVVYTIRRDRAGAVQTKEQYAFIYKALNLYATKLAGGVLDST